MVGGKGKTCWKKTAYKAYAGGLKLTRQYKNKQLPPPIR